MRSSLGSVLVAASLGCAAAPGEDPLQRVDAQSLPSDPGDTGEAEPNVAASCPWPVQVVVYGERAWNPLADALAANPSPCANYYVSLPSPADDKTEPRAGADVDAMHARGDRLHALAELQWASWNAYVQATDMTWYAAGVEFRRRMATAGYDPARGDAWAINELPSAVRSDDGVRAGVRNLLHGLYDGPAGATPIKGAVFVVGMSQGTTNFDVYKANLRDWLGDAAFWADANRYARFWGQEVYADPARTCVPGSTVGLRATVLNEFAMHVPRLAVAGAGATATARAFFDHAYVPLVNAAWQTPVGYGSTDISLANEEQHVSGQIYATRAWATTHDYPDGRVGIGWSPNDLHGDPGFSDEVAADAARLAAAVHDAYDADGAARYACSPSGAYTFCQCAVAGASFDRGWQTFDDW
jgi:hypothetical protein